MKNKFLLSIFALVILSSVAFSQINQSGEKITTFSNKQNNDQFYFTLSGGPNNLNGLVGVGFEYAKENVSFSLGTGVSSWGTKTSIGAKYYTKGYLKGWAFGTGLSYSAGTSTKIEIPNSIANYGKVVSIEYLAVPSLNIFINRYWHIGKKENRFHISLGIASGLSKNIYRTTPNIDLIDAQKALYKSLSPGGIILGFGFDFGVKRKQ